MTKKIYFYLIIFIIVVMYVCILINSVQLKGLPKGEKIYQIDSPNKTYTMNIYFIDGGPISADADRIEIVDNKNNKKWNIYYQYKGNLKKYSWIDNDNVSINGNKINIHKDKYHLKD